MATASQIAHIKQHEAEFRQLTDSDSVDDYFHEYAHIPDLYERLCSDLDITPIKPEEGDNVTQTPDITQIIQEQIQQALGTIGNDPSGAPAGRAKTFEEVLRELDPRDSEAALLMLDYLLQTGRLNRVGVLDGGQGYMFIYREPKGTTKQGYVPGGTQGDRMVDAAVEQARAQGRKPAKSGLCKHCFSAVRQFEGEPVTLDDESGTKGDADVCNPAPEGKHEFA